MSVEFGDIDLNSDLVPIEENKDLDEITTAKMVNSLADDTLINQSSNQIRADEARVSGVDEIWAFGVGNAVEAEVEGLRKSGETGASDGRKQLNGMVVKDFNGVKGEGGGTEVRTDFGVESNGVVVVGSSLQKDDALYQDGNSEIRLVVNLNADYVAYGERKFNGMEGFGINEKGNSSKDPSGALDGLVDNAAIRFNSLEIGKEAADDEKGCKNNDDFNMEREGDFHLSDLVWGKVTSHPWWPGQIYDPSCASKKALKYKKKESFLIAYYGDQSFAWNDASRIKPFRMYFSQMEKQSNMESFTHAVSCALDEYSRRVEYGLACSCLPKEVFSKIESQVIVNAGIRKKQGVTVGGDSFSTAASFVPAKLVHYMRELGETPFNVIDRLEFVTARAQLLAFNRWRGNAGLPSFNMLGGLLEDDFLISGKERDLNELMDYALVATKVDGKGKSVMQDSSSRKHKHVTGEGLRFRKKKKYMLELMPENYLDVEDKVEENADEKNTFPSGKKSTVVTVSRGENGKSQMSPAEKLFEVGDRIRKVVSQLSGSVSILRSGESTSQNGVNKNGVNNCRSLGVKGFIGNEYTVAEMLLHLSLFAGNPMKGGDKLFSVVRFFTDFRNSVCLENSSPGNSHLLTEGTEESYQTIMTSQGTSGEPIPNETEGEKEMPNVEEAAEQSNVNPSHANEELEKYSPTAFILNFSDLESIPSEANLNKIFRRHGPLIESDTEVLKKSKRAKVVFKRRDDAETAFSSTGKFSIFGPSLISYRLHYSPSPRKPSNPGKKRKRKNETSVKGKGNQLMIQSEGCA
ncbi:Hydroxy monocarboxylic acid anion dehydrogenase, HIBADH-type [Heracleum sosnowskyi]|uniref:Hydroxy monocarboxylic acid anion dehydrogenase, HIBADH-type n=1 Tax=Heracleum sosnowskyi TaxID=360622 RepID=A0AAD8JGU1_9APIA|nr:Hydroxy monocarboxylic acid anion dehydrogenase, HIBADH-type [Heracleum sosnowskyi]